MALNGKHQATDIFTKGEEHKVKRLREEEAQASTAVFQAYRRPLLTVTEFKYLGWFLTAYDDEWQEVVANIQKSLIRWSSFFRILGWERSDPRTSGTFYKAVVQVTLLFVSETWVVTPRTGRILGGFHH